MDTAPMIIRQPTRWRGETAVVPGKPDISPLIRVVQDQVEDLEMPPLADREKFPALPRETDAAGNLGCAWTQPQTL